MKKNAFVILLIIIISLINVKSVFASEFATSYEVIYELKSKTEVNVTYNVELENLTSEYFASEYAISVEELNLKNIVATQNDNVIPVTAEEINNKTNISTTLTKNIVGKGKRSNITISYSTDTLLKTKGNVLELTVPKLSAAETLNKYNVIIKSANTIGKELYLFPRPTNTYKDGEFTAYEFSNTDIKNNGINAVFGEFQLYELDLKYHLKNPTNKRVLQDITFPPDIKGRQSIVIKSLFPEPQRVYIDPDGNYLAEYLLEPSEDILINLAMDIKVVNFEYKTPLLDNTYTSSQPYWETDNDTVKKVLSELNLQNFTTNDEKASQIYNYIVTNYKYSTEKATIGNINREGVIYALNNPTQPVCMEYADSFIALSRAAGIPTREINGYAFTSGDDDKPLSLRLDGTNDVLHAWAEYYSAERGWVQVDPTWGSTSGLDYFTQFDTNHITFITHGQNSNYPYPAGSFKIDETEDNFINVRFKSDQQIPVDYKFEAVEVFRTDIKSILTLKTKTLLKNTSNTTIYNASLGNKQVGNIPPFGEVSIENNEKTYEISFESFTGTKISNELVIENKVYIRSLLIPIVVFILALMLFLYVIVRR